jgi:serine phosphatase RsbU (regulator of sigma subunit)
LIITTLCCFFAYSNADEVGVNYYDTFKLDEDRSSLLIIGDVSEKGTSARLIWPKMKGILQEFDPLNLSPTDSLIKANSAWANVSSGITSSILCSRINTERKPSATRAGHVPHYASNSILLQNQSI